MYVEVRLRGGRLIMRRTEESNKIVVLWDNHFFCNILSLEC